MAVTMKVPEVCRHGTPLRMTCGPCDRILPGDPEALIPDPIAPARGCAFGLLSATLCWVAILVTAAVVWLNVIAPKVLP